MPVLRDSRQTFLNWLETAKRHRIEAGLAGMLLAGAAGYGTVKGVQKIRDIIKKHQENVKRKQEAQLRSRVETVIGQEVKPTALVA